MSDHYSRTEQVKIQKIQEHEAVIRDMYGRIQEDGILTSLVAKATCRKQHPTINTAAVGGIALALDHQQLRATAKRALLELTLVTELAPEIRVCALNVLLQHFSLDDHEVNNVARAQSVLEVVQRDALTLFQGYDKEHTMTTPPYRTGVPGLDQWRNRGYYTGCNC